MARRASDGRPADITVILAHRNRADHRLINALRSLATQRYSLGTIRTLIIDYGSNPDQLERLRMIARDFGAECQEVKGGAWNKSHCLNIGLRRVETPYLMVFDVDNILADNYLTEAVSRMQRDPLLVVYSVCSWLPDSCTPELESAAAAGRPVDTAALKPLGRLRILPYGTGVVVGRTCFFHAIRGYDEFYELYGAEDDDLARRFEFLGLRPISIHEASYYLHQWHPRREGVQSEGLAEVRARNNEHLAKSTSIVRNPRGWGEERPAYISGSAPRGVSP